MGMTLKSSRLHGHINIGDWFIFRTEQIRHGAAMRPIIICKLALEKKDGPATLRCGGGFGVFFPQRYVVKKRYDRNYPFYYRYDVFDRHPLSRCIDTSFWWEKSANERAAYLNSSNTEGHQRPAERGNIP